MRYETSSPQPFTSRGDMGGWTGRVMSKKRKLITEGWLILHPITVLRKNLTENVFAVGERFALTLF